MTQVLRTWIKQIEINERFISGLIGLFLLIAFFVGVYRFTFNQSNVLTTLSDGNDSEISEIVSPSVLAETEKVGEVSSASISKYTVQEGDSLWKIAERTYNDGYQWVEIAKANNLDNVGLLAIGQELDLPRADDLASNQTALLAQADSSTANEIAAQQESNSQDSSQTQIQSSADSYTVQRGDYLWKIAEAHYGDGYQWTRIWKENKELITDPQVIFSGQTLRLPTIENNSQTLSLNR